MKALIENYSGRAGVFSFRKAKLLLCQYFHKRYRRRVDFSPTDTVGNIYKVRCLKCGLRDVELGAPPKTKKAS